MAIAGLSAVYIYKALTPGPGDTIERLFLRNEPFPALGTHDIFKVHAVPTGRWDGISALRTRELRAALTRSRLMFLFWGMPKPGIGFAACSALRFHSSIVHAALHRGGPLFFSLKFTSILSNQAQFSQLSRRACCLIINLVVLMAKDL